MYSFEQETVNLSKVFVYFRALHIQRGGGGLDGFVSYFHSSHPATSLDGSNFPGSERNFFLGNATRYSPVRPNETISILSYKIFLKMYFTIELANWG